MKNKSKYALLIACSFFLFSCGKKNTTTQPPIEPTHAIEQVAEFDPKNEPSVSLVPRSDGHEITLSITKIPNNVTSAEYEFIYVATDDETGLEIEKGNGDETPISNGILEKKFLMGTESCTNGCKYKYDNNVQKGKLSITFFSNNGNIYSYSTDFSLKTGAQIKKSGISLDSLIDIQANPASTSDYFILFQNVDKSIVVTSSSSGKGNVSKITPDTFQKDTSGFVTGVYSQ